MINTIKELLIYLIPYKSKLILGLSLLFISVAFEVINPKILGMAVDELNSKTINIQNIYFYAGLILGIMLIRGVILYYTRFILIGASRRVEYDIRNKLFKHILSLDPKFFDKNNTGDLLSRMTSDLEQIRMIYGPGIMYSINVVVLFILSIILMLSINVTITLISLLPMCLLAYLIKIVGKKYYEKSKALQEELAKMTHFVNENLQGIRVIKSYVKEGFVLDAFRKINLTFIKENLAIAKLNGIFRPMLILIAGFI